MAVSFFPFIFCSRGQRAGFKLSQNVLSRLCIEVVVRQDAVGQPQVVAAQGPSTDNKAVTKETAAGRPSSRSRSGRSHRRSRSSSRGRSHRSRSRSRSSGSRPRRSRSRRSSSPGRASSSRRTHRSSPSRSPADQSRAKNQKSRRPPTPPRVSVFKRLGEKGNGSSRDAHAPHYRRRRR